MSDCSDILISLAPTHTQAILSGRKTVELRRRRMHVTSGTRVWIYSKVPVGSVQATAVVEHVFNAEPEALWAQFQQAVGISRSAFNAYFAGCAHGCAVVLREIRPVQPAMKLAHLRSKIAAFQPPQFFKRLRKDQRRVLINRQGSRRAVQAQITSPASDRLRVPSPTEPTETPIR